MTTAWDNNQAADVSVPSALVGYVEARANTFGLVEDDVASNLVNDGTLTLSSVNVGGVGATHRVSAQQTFPVQTSMTGYEYTITVAPAIWVDFADHWLLIHDATGVLLARIEPAQSATVTGLHKESFPEVVGAVSATLVFVNDGAFTIGLAYSNGDYVGGALTTPYGSGESAGDDLTFTVYGMVSVEVEPAVYRWDVDNTAAKNAVTLALTHEFDYTRATLPLETSHLVIENGVYGGVSDDDYDFTNTDTAAWLANPGTMTLNLGYTFADGTIETVPAIRHLLGDVSVDDDDLYATFNAESFASILDDDKFYGGRYAVGGIAASTLFAEILTSARFPVRGWWNYILGDATCVASSTRPLWGVDFSYYTIDAAFDSVMVDIPIPVVTHREALIMLAAYVGAYIIHDADGTLSVTSTLPAHGTRTLGSTCVYDRPVTVNGKKIHRASTTLASYSAADATSAIIDTTFVLPSLDQTTLRLTHAACSGGSLALTGGAVVGSPVYNTYSTVFTVAPTSTSLAVVLTAYPVTIATRILEKQYLDSGDVVDLACPIASNSTLATAMLDHYVSTSATTRFEFTMRDDPAVRVGDRLHLQVMSTRAYGTWNYIIGQGLCAVSATRTLWSSHWTTILPIVVTRIARDFNGGLTAKYTVAVDTDATLS